ncbi:MAG TPA: HDOD domain-containing protein [Steroidobacteraceae bacterium]|jgi:EAL and modified HD-GYP domain-containing signal transduction protein|nr:HDOD domain-containing protein [Steroidobacteraceae bacterium]
MEGIFIGRQPILDRAGNLYAYELLHRRGDNDHATDDDGDRMSSDMLLNAALEVGIKKINAACPVFINVTRNILLNGGLDSLPSERLGLEVLETVSVDEPLLERLRVLRSLGFKIALDDFVFSPERAPLIEHADIIKLDVLALNDAELERHVRLLKGRGVRLVAEKVETRTMHARALALGFDLFQGYFFARPEKFKSQTIRPNNLVLLQLLARVHDPNITPEELGSIIRGDVSMSVTVLRWANSPLYGLLHAVESVERAVIVLGLYTIRNWVSLLTLARIGGNATELHTTILVRARTCELLATAAAIANPSSYFTVGLLSALDIILQVDMVQALECIPLVPEQKAALLTRSGSFGDALNCVMALESGDEAAVKFSRLKVADISRCYFSAIDWVNQLGGTSAAARLQPMPRPKKRAPPRRRRAFM